MVYYINPSEDDRRSFLSHLLGTATPRERADLDRRLRADRGLRLWFEIAEDELVEDYVFGNLTPRERRLFERHYLATTAHVSKLRFIQSLIEYANSGRARGDGRKPARR